MKNVAGNKNENQIYDTRFLSSGESPLLERSLSQDTVFIDTVTDLASINNSSSNNFSSNLYKS